jgi:1-acyl-sn-glycerol-3-phosphate acyltransferase
MFSFVKQHLRGIFTMFLFLLDTLVLTIPFYTIALVKFLLPIKSWRIFWGKVLNKIGDIWVFFFNHAQCITGKTKWVVHGADFSDPKKSCLLMVNHQTWVDIMVLVKLFYTKVPAFKFFVKKELLWLPIIGQAFWALDFPIMKRFPKNFLEENPHLKGKDLEMTKNACEKFKHISVSVFNFVEGTRFREEKHDRQKSPFAHLLKPRAGGTALVLNAMGDTLCNILNVTIVYPQGVQTFWDYLCGKVGEVRVHVERMPIKKEMIGDYFNDPDFRKNFQLWINDLWWEKDRRIDEMMHWEQA